jgi:hypothetical protein
MSGRDPGLRAAGLRRAGDPGGGGGAGGPIVSTDITDSSAPGRAVLKAATAALQRTALGLAAIASSGVSADITDATAAGRALLTAATAALQRTALGLAAIASSGLSADITDATAAGRALLTAATAALQRTALGLAAIASSGLASDLSGSIAIANGGTGQATAIAAGDALQPLSANLAGASTTDLSTVTGPTVNVTGTGATITALGVCPAGVFRRTVFASSGSALIHNSSTLILPYATSIVVGAGDVFEWISLGSGNWRCTAYQPALAAAVRTALGLAAMATSAVAANITDATAVGRSMLTAASQAAQTALIAVATQALAGLMSAADKVIIDGAPRIFAAGSFTAQTTQTFSFAANAYKRICLVLDWDTSPCSPTGISLTGLSAGSYIDSLVYSLQVGGNLGNAGLTGANSWNVSGAANTGPGSVVIEFEVPPAPRPKQISFRHAGISGGNYYTEQGAGISSDFTHDPTAIVVVFAGSTGGHYTLWGTP